MKKCLSKVFLIVTVVMTAVMCLVISTAAVETEEFVDGDYEYVVEDSKAKITKYRGDDGNFYIYVPENIGGYEVSGIENKAFYDLNYVAGIIFPDDVEHISEGAITYCPSLKYVSLGKNTSYINGAFVVNCKKLERIYVVEENNNFLSEDGVLYNKNKTEIIKYPSAKIGSEFIIPDGIVKIGKASFEDCKNLASVFIPEGVTVIDDYAFEDCNNFTSVIIPDSVTIIGDFAFACSETDAEMGSSSMLENVKLSKNITRISQGLFSGCAYLKEIDIPETVVEIGDYAFENCFSLKALELPSALTEIGDYAFAGCRILWDISFPEGLISIGQNVLYDSGYSYNESNWKNNCLYVGCYLVKADFNAEPGIYEIDKKTKLIAEQAFKGCVINYLSIPEGIETIGYRTFAFSLIEYIEIPKSVKKIGYQAFYDCAWYADIDYNFCYNASQKEWNNIEIATGNEDLSYAKIHFKESDQEDLPHSHQYTLIKSEDADCTKSGTKTYTCTCGDTYTETIAKKAHTYKSTTTKATTTTDGKIENKCSLCGDVEKTETIAKIKSVTLSKENYVYDGKNKTPTVMVTDANGKKLVKNTDYKLSVASKRSGIGRYTVKVTLIGNYEGTKNVYFYIKPGKTDSVKSASQTTSSIKLSWNAVPGAAGYTVYRYSPSKKAYVKAGTTEGTSLTVKNLYTGTKYTFRVVAYGKTTAGKVYDSDSYALLKTATKTKTPTLSKVTASSTKGKAVITHTNVSGETGYTVYYSTKKDSGFKKYANFKADTTTCNITGLTSGKTYYFKVRTYIKTDSGYVYSAWSTVKSVKIAVNYYVTKTGTKYHVDGCSSLSKSKIPISYKDAVAKGYKACDKCIK